MTKGILPDGWTDYIPLIIFIFTCGITYNVIESQETRDDEIENRLKKKIELLNELTDRVEELENYKAWEEGYNEAEDKYNTE